jgi:hypothetical protein
VCYWKRNPSSASAIAVLIIVLKRLQKSRFVASWTFYEHRNTLPPMPHNMYVQCIINAIHAQIWGRISTASCLHYYTAFHEQ